jgi:hypothetical protein
VGYPFYCTDYYGQTGLLFSPLGPDEDTKKAIAGAFWSLLLKEPDDLADFEAEVWHTGTRVLMLFCCADGEPYCDETDESEEE